MNVEELGQLAARSGYWMRWTTPFGKDGLEGKREPLGCFTAGFCPHETTGWNGRMDELFSDPDPAQAIRKAAEWLAEVAP